MKLEMRGFTVPDDDHVMEKEFLSEVMEFNEQLEEIENDDHLRETSQLIEGRESRLHASNTRAISIFYRQTNSLLGHKQRKL